MRRTYEIGLPRGMTQAQVLDFVRSAIGELPRPQFLRPAYTLVFEKYATKDGKRYFIHVPGHVRTKIDKLLDKKIEGISIEPVKASDDVVAQTKWEKTVELAMRGINDPLRIIVPEHVAASIDANFEGLDDDESIVLQWIVFPDRPRRPDEASKEKVKDYTLHAVARIGTKGTDAKQMMLNLTASLRSVNSHGSVFSRRMLDGFHLLDVSGRINRRAGSLGYPIFLNAPEFTALMGWQLDGQAGVRARKLPVDPMVDTEGIVVGSSNYHKTRGRALAIPPSALLMHTWVLGPSGVGKSTVLHNMAVQIMDQGLGLVLIEPKGDLAWDVLKSVPEQRVNDVIWFNPADTQYPIGLNVLAGHDVERITGHVVGMFRDMYDDSWGSRLERILKFAVKTAAINDLTLYDVRHLLINQDFRAREVAKIRQKDQELWLEWRWLDSITDTAVDSVINKLDNFLGSRTLRNIVGQQKGLSMSDVVENRKILLVPLPSALIGQTNTSALGSLVRELLWDEVRRRPAGKREPIILMMDEFQNYSDLNTTRSDPFAEARSYGLGLVIANQHTGQLPNAVLSSVSNNTASKIAFGLEPEDAKKLKDSFGPLTAEELGVIPRYGVVARLMTSTGKAPVTTAMTAPPPMPTGAGKAALDASRARYGRPVHEVEAEFVERHKTAPEDSWRPKIGGKSDG